MRAAVSPWGWKRPHSWFLPRSGEGESFGRFEVQKERHTLHLYGKKAVINYSVRPFSVAGGSKVAKLLPISNTLAVLPVCRLLMLKLGCFDSSVVLGLGLL